MFTLKNNASPLTLTYKTQESFSRTIKLIDLRAKNMIYTDDYNRQLYIDGSEIAGISYIDLTQALRCMAYQQVLQNDVNQTVMRELAARPAPIVVAK